MKILVDTCIWSLALRRKSQASLSGDERLMLTLLEDTIQDGRVAIVGPVRQEALSGIKEPAQFNKLKTALQAFPDEPIPSVDFEEAARLYNLCRSRGIECGQVDILLCAVASRQRWSILTNDGGLKRCIKVLHAEKIF
jgi:predicted nucleic acid-binding protein